MAMKKLFDDDALRARLSERGRRRASFFSWEKAVGQIHSAYMTVLGLESPTAPPS